MLRPRSVVLGPMAGVADAPFRGICRQMGASLTYTEMVSAKGLHYNPRAPACIEMLAFDPEEIPCAVQLFGSDPDIVAEQAARILDEHPGKVALIDINMGCPVSKVVSKGDGAALMRAPKLAERIVARVVESVTVPVTVKFRKGWDACSVNAVDFARAMEAAGAAALTVHGRTRHQFYTGEADWAVIAQVKEAVSVPVTGSGDVFTARDAQEMFEETGVDAVMIARGARGNPWIFREARALLDQGEILPPPTDVERIDMAREHARKLAAFAGEHSVARMRKHVAWYICGMPDARHLRERVNRVESFAALDAMLLAYRAHLLGEEAQLEPQLGT